MIWNFPSFNFESGADYLCEARAAIKDGQQRPIVPYSHEQFE